MPSAACFAAVVAVARTSRSGDVGLPAFPADVDTAGIGIEMGHLRMRPPVFPLDPLMAPHAKRLQVGQRVRRFVVREGDPRLDVVNLEAPRRAARLAPSIVPLKCHDALCGPIGAAVVLKAAPPNRAIHPAGVTGRALPLDAAVDAAEVVGVDVRRAQRERGPAGIASHRPTRLVLRVGRPARCVLHLPRTPALRGAVTPSQPRCSAGLSVEDSAALRAWSLHTMNYTKGQGI